MDLDTQKGLAEGSSAVTGGAAVVEGGAAVVEGGAPEGAIANDTRDKNTYFSFQSVSTYFNQYADSLHQALRSIDMVQLEKAVRLIGDVRTAGGQVYIAGNGGSAAIADHLCCDWTKGTDIDGVPPLRTQSLACNAAVVTALANDLSYAQIFSAQLKYNAQPGDLVILISSSGNSPNVVEAALWAKSKKIPVISLVGFEGGKLRASSDACLHVPFHNYGIVEDSHQSLMHVIAQFVYLDLKQRKKGTA